MKILKRADGEIFNLLELYFISKILSGEILLEEFIQSRGAYHSTLSEQYVKTKKYLTKKLIFTKLFYAIIFGVLPIIPLFAYFEYINLLLSGTYDFELILFAISIFYGFFFLLQFFNFLLMTIMETTVLMSGKTTEWFKTLPLSHVNLKRIMYFTIFKNFDIPIIVIIFAFPITMLIGTGNFLLFFISLGISFINTFLGFNLIILISKRLNQVLNVNDVSSKKTFFIRLFNIFSYVFFILGSVYLIQWAFSSLGDYFDLFIIYDDPTLINIVLSIIPYPFSQSYLIALTFAPTYSTLPIWIGTSTGFGLLLVISYLLYKAALKTINKLLNSEPIYKSKTVFIKDLKKKIEIKPKSSFRAFLRKDVISASRDLKVFLSFITPLLLSFMYVIYLNLPNINISEPVEFQIFRIWLKYLLITPVISSLLVFSLLNLESTGQSILESLPLLPREQAKAKLLLMFLILTLAVVLPSLLFLPSSGFLVIFFGIFLCLPYAWFFLLLSFELRIYFFGKRFKSYVVGDLVIGNNYFKLMIIFVVPLSLCVWLISVSTLISAISNPFIPWAGGFNSLILIGGFIFTNIFFNKLFPIIRLYPEEINLQSSIRTIEKPTFFTRHIWISIILLLILDVFFTFIVSILTSFFLAFIPLPFLPFYSDELIFTDYFLFFLYYLIPIINLTIMKGFLYFVLTPKLLGIPFGRKKISQFFDLTGLSWLKAIFKNIRFVIIGFGVIILITAFTYFPVVYFPSFYLFYELPYFIYSLSMGFWLEIIFRAIILNFLILRYKKTCAMAFHLAIVIVFQFFSFPLVIILFSSGIRTFPSTFFLHSLLFLLYNLIMGYIFIKSKSLLPNIIITILITLFYFPLGLSPIYWYFPYFF